MGIRVNIDSKEVAHGRFRSKPGETRCFSVSVDFERDRESEVQKKQIPRFARDDIVGVGSAVGWGTPHPHLIAEECASD